ncbi:MAG: PAS domain S-box protein [Deltaproteobacteria bacterium]|nr:PAS domain S-box protein [Deltaproteobacteria bacterium]
MAGQTHSWLCRAIVDSTPDAMIFADRDGIIRLWNQAAESLFGYTSKEAIGKSLDIIVPENLRPRHWEGYRRVMATGETKYGKDMLAVPGIRKDGTRVSLEFSVAILRDTGGQLLGVAAVLRDVTTRWKKEKDLLARLAALEAERKEAG